MAGSVSIEDVEKYIDAVADRCRRHGAGAGGADYVRILRAADAMVAANGGGRRGRAVPEEGEGQGVPVAAMSRQQRRAAARAQAKKQRKTARG